MILNCARSSSVIFFVCMLKDAKGNNGVVH